MDTKQCSHCGRLLPTTHYYRNRGTLSAHCKDCQGAKTRAYSQSPKGRALSRANAKKQYAKAKATPEGRAKIREATKAAQARYREEHKKEIYARERIRALCRRGKMGKPTVCPCCGAEGSIEAHHYDYTRPLFIDWLCKGCHSEAHREGACKEPSKDASTREALLLNIVRKPYKAASLELLASIDEEYRKLLLWGK